MSNQDAEDLSPEISEFRSHRSMRQFALGLKQRRTLKQQEVQFARAVQIKYPADEETESSTTSLKRFVPQIGARKWMLRKSQQGNPCKLGKTKPLEISSSSSKLDSIDAALPNLSLDLSPEVAKAKSLDPQIRSSNRSITEIEELESKVNHSNFQILESPVQTFLSRILNIRIPSIRIYANTLSDRLAKKYNADALTYPDKILFRLGKYAPRQMTGLALLGHEFTHLEQFNRQNTSSTPENSAIAETEALGNERKVFHYISAQEDPAPGNSLGFSPSWDSFTDSHQMTPLLPIPQVIGNERSAPMPKAALSDREISLPPSTPQPMNPVSPLSELQLNSIKDEVYRDLRQRLRTESERGS